MYKAYKKLAHIHISLVLIRKPVEKAMLNVICNLLIVLILWISVFTKKF